MANRAKAVIKGLENGICNAVAKHLVNLLPAVILKRNNVPKELYSKIRGLKNRMLAVFAYYYWLHLQNTTKKETNMK